MREELKNSFIRSVIGIVDGPINPSIMDNASKLLDKFKDYSKVSYLLSIASLYQNPDKALEVIFNSTPAYPEKSVKKSYEGSYELFKKRYDKHGRLSDKHLINLEVELSSAVSPFPSTKGKIGYRVSDIQRQELNLNYDDQAKILEDN